MAEVFDYRNIPSQLITVDPALMSGTPVFTGTRVPVKSLFDWLETETMDAFLENFPGIEREQALAVLRHCSRYFLYVN